MCPHCGKNAPIVHRGLAAYCTACGRPRMPLSGTTVNMAGKPSKVGGVLASVLGWAVLIGGGTLAVVLALLLGSLFPGTPAPWIVGLPIGIASLSFALLLLFGGRKLRESGVAAERDAQTQAVLSLAANRRGTLVARDVASALDIPVEEADALLTTLAKSGSEQVEVEIGERGEIFYVFPEHARGSRARFGTPATPGVRVDARPAAGWQGVDRTAEAEAEAAEEEAAAARRHERLR